MKYLKSKHLESIGKGTFSRKQRPGTNSKKKNFKNSLGNIISLHFPKVEVHTELVFFISTWYYGHDIFCKKTSFVYIRKYAKKNPLVVIKTDF